MTDQTPPPADLSLNLDFPYGAQPDISKKQPTKTQRKALKELFF